MTDLLEAPSGTPVSTVPPTTTLPIPVAGPAGSGSGTVLPRLEREPRRGPEQKRSNGIRISDLLSIVGAAIASLSVTSLVFAQLAPVSGPIAFAAVAYVLFVLVYAVLVAIDETGPVVRDRVIAVAVHSLAFTVFATLVFVVAFSVIRGLDALPHWNFYTRDMSLTGPLDPLTSGGVVHAIAGSLIQITIALVITVPLGITTALFLNEVPGPFARFVRTIVEAMTALPSIVAGLFIYASVILVLGVNKSGLAAALAISVMMLPIMIRSADVVLRLVPSTLKEASIGLGAGQWRTVFRVVLPTSRSGLVTAIILATARGIGETSPVLLTSGFTTGLNLDPLHGPMISLPLAIFEFVKSPEPTMIARGFGTAAVLMFLVLALFAVARIIGGETVARRERRADFFRAIGPAIGRAVSRPIDALENLTRTLTTRSTKDTPREDH
ncbi:Phosphate transport system permease protein PstA [Frondihabitans sp. 762G35]|uniref:phosphate ABC transporter permease PstA n=1 Tax=Frondihabitans sp. 762G35 TaxID=1446794 RepID=UPI000D205F3F|nr:phosphate ABC transporter permease PstA [Frondihabitans sp. 762G35]ARC57508.1 Phosphate transport system permease protein PstA [Frondihabitans sp. 762G35]